MNSNTALLVDDTIVHYLALPATGFQRRRFGDISQVGSHHIGTIRKRALSWLGMYLCGAYVARSRRREFFFLPETIYLGKNLTLSRAQIVEYFLEHPRKRYVISNEYNPGYYRLALTPVTGSAADSALRNTERQVGLDDLFSLGAAG